MPAPSGDTTVLLIDHNRALVEPLSAALAKQGIRLEYASSAEQGLEMLQDDDISIALFRDELEGGLDAETIAEFQVGAEAPEIIVFSTRGDENQVRKLVEMGIWEYLVHASPEHLLPEVIEGALAYRRNKRVEMEVDKKSIRSYLDKHGIIGRSDIMQKCVEQAITIAQSDANVLIYGESGTGKELFASTIHEFSRRAHRPMTIIDCAALAPALVESTLFGHVKGSFTGADKAQAGLVGQSESTTLFLDEIGEISLDVQKKLLRVIQEGTYMPVGSTTYRTVDFRLIAASNRDLEAMAAAGTFREDLLFRLKTHYLELPVLRGRATDITELAYYQRNLICKQQRLKKKKLSPDYLLQLTDYNWPGNVRELFQAIERSIIEAKESDTLYPMHLPPEIRIQNLQDKLGDAIEDPGSEAAQVVADDVGGEAMPSLKKVREQAVESCERSYLETLLEQTGGNIAQCCTIAGLSRSRLYDLLKKYGLSKS